MDQAIQHGRNSQRPLATVWFGYHYPSYRLWLIAAFQQLLSNPRPVLLEIPAQRLDVHVIHAGAATIASDLAQRTDHVASIQYALH